MLSQSLRDFKEYDKFISGEVTKFKRSDQNIPGLECRRGQGRIDYRGSTFDRLSRIIKDIYATDLYKFNPDIKSFVSIFDFQGAYSLPVNLYFHFSPVANIFKKHNANTPWESEVKTKYGFNMAQYNFEERNTGSLKEYYLKIGDNNSRYVDPQIEYIEQIVKNCKDGKTLLAQGLSFNMPNFLHMIALIGWYDTRADKMVIGIYDPIYHERAKSKYKWAMRYAFINLNILFAKIGVPVEIINLSEFCLRGEKGLHCPQYTIDAEYCSMYSLYFLYVYAKNGMPREEAGLRRVVKDAFIVDPVKLRREPCDETNEFRFKTMSFIMSVLILYGKYSKSDNVSLWVLNNIKTIVGEILESGGVNLLHPEIEMILDSRIKKLGDILEGKRNNKMDVPGGVILVGSNHGGGMRRRARRKTYRRRNRGGTRNTSR